MSRPLSTAVVALCLAVFLGLSAVALSRESCTFDEGAHLVAGHAILARHDYRLAPDNPPLARILAALPIQFMGPRWPTDDERWREPAAWHLGFEFLYRSGNDPDRFLMAARLTTVLSTVLLILVVYWTALQSFGSRGGIIALLLITFCPALLAYGHLVTPDVLATLAILATLLSFRRIIERPSGSASIICGVLLGCSLATKFNAVCLLPAMVGMAILHEVRSPAVRVGWTQWALTSLVIVGTAYGVVWAVYGFRYAASPDPSFLFAWDQVEVRGSAVDWLVNVGRSLHLLPEAFLYGVQLMHGNTVHGLPAYALGLRATQGWWWYFPLTFLVKTPVSMLVLYAAGVALAIRAALLKNATTDFAILLLIVYWMVVVGLRFNLGLRHLLPVYPAFIFLAAGIPQWSSGRRLWRPAIVTVLVALAVSESLVGAPSYLAYFNLASRALGQPHEILADTNLDWGQDLAGLKRLMDREGIPEVKLAYFGVASPAHLGLRHQVLPAFNVYSDFERQWPAAGPFVPGDIVAISVTSLVGVYDAGSRYYLTRFGHQEPLARIGNSIFVYRVPAE